MRLYLIRHGIAAPLETPRSKDAERPLTPLGIRKMRLAARGLAHLIPRSALLFTSPATRTRQTAKVIFEECSLRRKVKISEALAAHATPTQISRTLRSLKNVTHVVIVGHEPNLSQLASSLLLNPGQQLPIQFKKGALCVIEIPTNRENLPAGKLLLHLSPRVLRKLGQSSPS